MGASRPPQTLWLGVLQAKATCDSLPPQQSALAEAAELDQAHAVRVDGEARGRGSTAR
jgi:hypothetical protein